MDNHNKPQSPLCTTCKPNIFTNKNLNLCADILTTKVSTSPKTNSTCSKRELLIWTFHFCTALSDSIQHRCLSFAPFCAQFNRELAGRTINVKRTLRRGAPSRERKEYTVLNVIWRLGGLGERLLLLSVGEHEALMVTHFHRGSVTILQSTALVPGQRSTSWEHFSVIILPTCSVETLILSDSKHFYTWPTHPAVARTHIAHCTGLCLGSRTSGAPWVRVTQRALRPYALKHPFRGKHLEICIHKL